MKYLVILFLLTSCITSKKEDKEQVAEDRIKLEIITTKGNILVELYNETPLHRDNFLKLVKENFYDSLLFHRVIDDFIIQTGDPNSLDAQPGQQLGYGDLDYLIQSEIVDTIFHKRGSLSAAHDGNIDFYSSAAQFVIVQKGPVPDSSFTKMENWINKNLKLYNFFHADSNTTLYNKTQKAYKEHDWELYNQLYDSVSNINDSEENLNFYRFPEEHKTYYRKYGGTPFNDRLYTVFGEVITGMNIVDSIAKVATDNNDRPVSDIRIISIKVLN